MLGIVDATAEELDRFDAAYMAFYPYLWPYLATANGARVLEIGTGYGTVGRVLLAQGVDYTGLDIAPGPVSMTPSCRSGDSGNPSPKPFRARRSRAVRACELRPGGRNWITAPHR